MDKLKKFDPTVLSEQRKRGNSPVIGIIGKRSSGKTVLVQDLMFYLKEIKTVVCYAACSPRRSREISYEKHIHPLLIHDDNCEKLIEKVIEQQKKKLRNKLNIMNNFDVGKIDFTDIDAGLIIDGIEEFYEQNKNIILLFANGRCWKISFIYTSQCPMRSYMYYTNTDYFFIFRENILSNKKNLYSRFKDYFKDFLEFEEIFLKATEDNGCLVIHNSPLGFENCLFWYKAELNREYKIGSENLWSYLDSKLKIS